MKKIITIAALALVGSVIAAAPASAARRCRGADGQFLLLGDHAPATETDGSQAAPARRSLYIRGNWSPSPNYRW